MSKLCEYCGAELDGTEKVCPKCGAPTNNVEQTKVNNTTTKAVDNTVSYDQTAQNGNQKKGGYAVKIIIAVLVLAAIAGVTVLLMNLLG